MDCPFCSERMARGEVCAPNESIPYWLPEDAPPNGGWRLSVRRIEQRGGVILGRASNVGMIAKWHPDSFYCERCGCLITMLRDAEP